MWVDDVDKGGSGKGVCCRRVQSSCVFPLRHSKIKLAVIFVIFKIFLWLSVAKHVYPDSFIYCILIFIKYKTI